MFDKFFIFMKKRNKYSTDNKSPDAHAPGPFTMNQHFEYERNKTKRSYFFEAANDSFLNCFKSGSISSDTQRAR